MKQIFISSLNKKYAERKGIAHLVFSGYLRLCEYAAAFGDSFDKTHISARPTAFYSKPRLWLIHVCGRKICMNGKATATSSER